MKRQRQYCLPASSSDPSPAGAPNDRDHHRRGYRRHWWWHSNPACNAHGTWCGFVPTREKHGRLLLMTIPLARAANWISPGCYCCCCCLAGLSKPNIIAVLSECRVDPGAGGGGRLGSQEGMRGHP